MLRGALGGLQMTPFKGFLGALDVPYARLGCSLQTYCVTPEPTLPALFCGCKWGVFRDRVEGTPLVLVRGLDFRSLRGTLATFLPACRCPMRTQRCASCPSGWLCLQGRSPGQDGSARPGRGCESAWARTPPHWARLSHTAAAPCPRGLELAPPWVWSLSCGPGQSRAGWSRAWGIMARSQEVPSEIPWPPLAWAPMATPTVGALTLGGLGFPGEEGAGQSQQPGLRMWLRGGAPAPGLGATSSTRRKKRHQ